MATLPYKAHGDILMLRFTAVSGAVLNLLCIAAWVSCSIFRAPVL